MSTCLCMMTLSLPAPQHWSHGIVSSFGINLIACTGIKTSACWHPLKQKQLSISNCLSYFGILVSIVDDWYDVYHCSHNGIMRFMALCASIIWNKSIYQLITASPILMCELCRWLACLHLFPASQYQSHGIIPDIMASKLLPVLPQKRYLSINKHFSDFNVWCI